MNNDRFEEAANMYLAMVRERHNDYYEANYPNLPRPVFDISFRGGVNAKVFSVSSDGRPAAVHSFVNKASGDVLKPAGWSAPAKHARGNIYSDEFGSEALDYSGCVRHLK